MFWFRNKEFIFWYALLTKGLDLYFVDDVMRLEVPTACRHATQTMRSYLATIYPVYLSSAPPELIDQFVDMYEHAKHRPEVIM